MKRQAELGTVQQYSVRYNLPFGTLPMTNSDKEKLIRQYAAHEITWHGLRERGFDSYLEVLRALGELGLRPPVAAMTGPNIEARERGRAIIREALKAQK